MNSIRTNIIAAVVFLMLVSACGPPSLDLPILPEIVTTLQTERETEVVELQQTTSISGTPIPETGFRELLISVAPYLPHALQSQITASPNLALTHEVGEADFRLDIGDSNVISRLVYALVAPFPTITDGVTSEQLHQTWQGDPAGPFAKKPLLMEQATLDLFSLWWGPPSEGVVEVLPADELLTYAWENRPSWSIVPFDALEPRWKVLQVDGQSPIWKGFDPAVYALSLPISITTNDDSLLPEFSTRYGPESPNPLVSAQNIDPNKLTTVILTGVTALVRATAWEMERKGITHPAGDIGDLLRAADITHISNEVPFAVDCPPPDPIQVELVFCSDPSYIELLEIIGTDVVELTGDHFGDWEAEGMYYTLQLYDDYGLPYYGGGANAEEARQALLFEHNGNQIAFIGCNGKGVPYATATDTEPGAVVCDYDWMNTEIARLRDEGNLVIVTFQHAEYYTYEPKPYQMVDFRSVAEAGATIVSGSQAHQAQGMEFFEGALVMYGLGNLFFDQLSVSEDTAQAIIARHVFYDGRHISTELISIKFVDYARPRLMTPKERILFLTKVFEGSGW